jgi:hypothetical protein
MLNAKGMVQLGDATYRIAEVGRGRYHAIRILDDVRIGTFETLPMLRVKAEATEEKVLFAVARLALMQGKTSWPRTSATASGSFVEPGVTSSAVCQPVTDVKVCSRADVQVLPRRRSSRTWLNAPSLAIFARLWRGPLVQRVAA